MDEQMRAMDRSLLEKIKSDIEMIDKDEGNCYSYFNFQFLLLLIIFVFSNLFPRSSSLNIHFHHYQRKIKVLNTVKESSIKNLLLLLVPFYRLTEVLA